MNHTQFYILFLLLVGTIGYAQIPQLIIDRGVHPGDAFDLSPEEFFDYNGLLFFWADDGNLGEEPHFYNSGTDELISFDINKGASNGLPSSATDAVAIFNRYLYFSAADKLLGAELWRSDGQSVELVADINKGSSSSNPQYFEVFQGRLYFRATGKNGAELYAIDTDHKLEEIIDINLGPGSSRPQFMTSYKDQVLVFVARKTNVGCDIWVTKGTASTTIKIATMDDTGFCNIRDWTAFDDHILFTYDSDSLGKELYFTDGRTVSLIEDINPGPNSSNPNGFTVLNGSYFFEANDGVNGNQLWMTNTNPGSTVPITTDTIGTTRANYLTPYNNELYFEGSLQTLWKSDGTIGNATAVLDLDQSIGGIVQTGSNMYIDASELWVSDGTANGTIELNPVNANGSSGVDNLFGLQNAVYFSAYDGLTGRELYTNTNTAVSTQVADINQKNSSFISSVVPFNSNIYFRASSFDNFMYVSDGTNIAMFLSSVLSSDHYSVTPIAAWNGDLYFHTLYSGTNQESRELWKTDGTESGTQLVKVLGSTYSHEQVEVLSTLGDFYFVTHNDFNYNIWQSDGTELGTILLYEDNNESIALFDGDVYHAKNENGLGRELYKNNVLLKDIYDDGGSNPENFIELNGWLYFTAYGGVTGRELWKTDGTMSGTLLVKDINPEIQGSSHARGFTILNNELYFRARDQSATGSPYQLWKSDGTTAGTTKVSEVEVRGQPIEHGDHLFFSGSDDGEEFELWTYDGFTVSLFKDINALSSSFPMNFFRFGDVLYFSADDCDHGRELWRSDGTADGTQLVYDLNPGPAASSPQDYTVYQDDLLFHADNGINGTELHILRPCSTTVNEVCNAGPCDLTTSYTASGVITMEGHFRIIDNTEISLNGGMGTHLLEQFEVENGGILNVLTIGCP